MKKAARSLALPVAVIGLLLLVAGYEQRILNALGIAALAPVQAALPHLISSGIWLAVAYLVNRVVGLVLWDPIHSRVPVPRLLRDVTGLLIYLLAITGIVGVVYDKPIGPFWAASGVGAIVLGLALRNVILDVFIGLAVNFDRPFEIGDYIQLGIGPTAGPTGRVMELNWRTTRLLNGEGNLVVIPNGRLSELIVTNFSRPERMSEFVLPIFLDFDVPTERALRVLSAAVASAAGSNGVLEQPAPKARLRGVSAQGVEYRIKYFVDPTIAGPGKARHEVLRTVLDQLHRAGLHPASPSQDVFHAPLPVRKLDARSADDRAQLLGRIELFKGLTDAERLELSSQMQERLVTEGTTLLRAGDSGASMFVLYEGLLHVTVKAESTGLETRVGRVHAGAFFGEMSALTGEPRSATVVAATDALMFEIDKEQIAALIDRRPELARVIAETVAMRRLRNSDALRLANAATVAVETSSLTSQLLGTMLSFFGISAKEAITTQQLDENSAQNPLA
ncbi:MAG: mechanosensitive ion channel family protein [bacterium]